MNPIALHKLPALPQPVHAAGQVTAVDGGLVSVRLPIGLIQGHIAASCLVQVSPGDRVLVSGESAEDAFVIAVLQRHADTPLPLRVEGDCHLEVSEGRLHIGASRGVQIDGGTDLKLSAAELLVHAAKTRLVSGQISVIGRALQATLEQVACVGSRVELVCQNLLQRLAHSVREVEGMDHVRSGQIDYQAKENLSLRGKNTLMTARELVKVDGDQIHLG